MSKHAFVEVKAVCPSCGCKRFTGRKWVRDAAGWLFIRRRCSGCGLAMWVRQVTTNEVDHVVMSRVVNPAQEY